MPTHGSPRVGDPWSRPVDQCPGRVGHLKKGPRVGDPWSRPADRLLWALRTVGLDYRCSPSGAWSWRATCPACSIAGALSIAEAGLGGAVSMSCRACPRERVLAALIGARERVAA